MPTAAPRRRRDQPHRRRLGRRRRRRRAALRVRGAARSGSTRSPAIVSAHPGVNHNYEREHRLQPLVRRHRPRRRRGRRLGRHARGADRLPARCACRMRRAYRIDLGFDLRGTGRGARPCARSGRVRVAARPTSRSPRSLEDGLPLVARPYAAWAEALARCRASRCGRRSSAGCAKAPCAASARSSATTKRAFATTR